MTIDAPGFSSTLNASVRNVISVWQNIIALKELIDRKITESFRASGLAPGNVNVASVDLGYCHDEIGDSGLCLKWAWAYPVKVPTGGKPRTLGHLYCWVALTPSHESEERESTFRPYIAFAFEYGKLDTWVDWECYYLDHDHPVLESDNDYWKEEAINIFPSEVISQTSYEGKDVPDAKMFAVYYPLDFVAAHNVESAIMRPLVSAIKKFVAPD